jgi:SpoVK/Ycf46/Vps4 family AAA+-type ATPase
MTEQCSGSDLKMVVRGAIMMPVRIATQATHFKPHVIDGVQLLNPCSPSDPTGMGMELMDVLGEQLHLVSVTREHIELALMSAKPSVGRENLEKHDKLTREKGKEGRRWRFGITEL